MARTIRLTARANARRGGRAGLPRFCRTRRGIGPVKTITPRSTRRNTELMGEKPKHLRALRVLGPVAAAGEDLLGQEAPWKRRISPSYPGDGALASDRSAQRCRHA